MSAIVEIDTGKQNPVLGREQGAKEPVPQARVAASSSQELKVSQERHRVAPIGIADGHLVRGQVRRRHQPGFSQINPASLRVPYRAFRARI